MLHATERFLKHFGDISVLLVGLAAIASARSALKCTANSAVPALVRAEGIAELVGDLVITCVGGTPTLNLSSGGNHGIAAPPDFQGYIIATCSFPYAHGFAIVSDLGSQRLAEGYLALILDGQSVDYQRSHVLGEALKH
jgi:hypothetical protein